MFRRKLDFLISPSSIYRRHLLSHSPLRCKSTSSINALQAAFKDPTSPFYLAPGTVGPDSPDAPPSNASQVASLHNTAQSSITYEETLDAARATMTKSGFDPASFWEQKIVWGDQDSFQHVNNAQYVRFFESARIKWMLALGNKIGGSERAEAMMRGQGVSLILKSIQVRFRRPVTYPDTLLVGYKTIPRSPTDLDPSTFRVKAAAYSLKLQGFAAQAEDELVWYDYSALKKCDPGEDITSLIYTRANRQ
ncbi:hypothetical protein BDN72DRAFT_820459 [Pluteus cervinus]|uniref:Uncharacterized protein n=1 Tax=Pluteus cervinus TaxID=181527 RepID=A0ACD3AT42_9AGAR|nr:hypothetical protein BDN72DRAFT_820459 [Pluteus cervinus]